MEEEWDWDWETEAEEYGEDEDGGVAKRDSRSDCTRTAEEAGRCWVVVRRVLRRDNMPATEEGREVEEEEEEEDDDDDDVDADS